MASAIVVFDDFCYLLIGRVLMNLAAFEGSSVQFNPHGQILSLYR
jgi:hypothetical protein